MHKSFLSVKCYVSVYLYMFVSIADIVVDELRKELRVGQLYNITCSAVCGTLSWEINTDRLSSSSPFVDSYNIIDQKCDNYNRHCEESSSLLPCDNAVQEARLFSRLSISFKTPGKYIVQCRSRIVFNDCETVYTFYSRHRSLTVQGTQSVLTLYRN